MSPRPSLLVNAGISDKTVAELAEHFDVRILASEGFDDVAGSVRAIATGGSKPLPDGLVERLPALELIACFGVGYEAVDAQQLARRRVTVTHTPNVLDDEVANTAVVLLLAVTRRIVAYDRYVRDGRWAAHGDPPFTRGLVGRTVGIVGLGRIGLAIAGKLSVFGCDIAYHNRKPRTDVAFRYFPTVIELARASDVLLLMTPGGAGTHHMIGREILDALGPQGTLINVGRGSVVDETELVAALQEHRLGAAGLDVFENEPHVPAALLDMDNVILLPHIGSATVETRDAMSRLLIDNLLAWHKERQAITPVSECRHLHE